MKAPLMIHLLNPAGRSYYCGMVALGLLTLGYSFYQIAAGDVGYPWLVLACLTAFAERFTVPIPGVKSKISVAESFIFANMILFGPAVGAVTAALDGFLGFLRSSKSPRRNQYTVFNMAIMAISAYLSGKVFFLILGSPPLFPDPRLSLREITFPAVAMALVHYLANTLGVTSMIALESRQNLFTIWRSRFLWTSLTYFAGSSAACLIAINARSITPTVVGLVLPVLSVTYFAFKTHLEKTEENEHRQQLDQLYIRTVEALSAAIDAREAGTLGQAKQLQVYALGLAREIGIEDENELRGIEAAALLLDIGNLAVPEYILNNPGQLTSAEFQKVRIHPVVGADILSAIDFPYPVVANVRHHHERWNGSGYPDGLKGEGIPLGARILALADCYVALTWDRPYQKARSREEALQAIRSWAGTRYDPTLVDRFIQLCGHMNERALHPNQIATETGSCARKPGGADSTKTAGHAQPPVNLVAYRDISLTQKEVTVLHELSVELGATLNLQGTFSTIACKIARIVPFTSCVLYLYSEATGRLVAECAAGEGADLLKNNSMDYGANISGWSVAQREPVMNADASLDLERLQDKLAIPLKTVLVCPLVFEGKVLGTISLYAAKEIKFKDDDLRIMSSITQKAAPAIQNALKYEEAQVEAAVDPLTSLPNVRYLRQFFAQVMNESLKSRHPLCVLVMDLDGFKAVNDFYGHQAGDRLLVEMSNVLRRTVRESDLVVRHGGDEFVAVLLRTTRHDAAEMASRIQREVDNRAFEVTPGRSVSVGISIGSASWPEDGNSLEELLHAADAAMYSDKRNRASQNRGALRR